jgi:hypothetical protein
MRLSNHLKRFPYLAEGQNPGPNSPVAVIYDAGGLKLALVVQNKRVTHVLSHGTLEPVVRTLEQALEKISEDTANPRPTTDEVKKIISSIIKKPLSRVNWAGSNWMVKEVDWVPEQILDRLPTLAAARNADLFLDMVKRQVNEQLPCDDFPAIVKFLMRGQNPAIAKKTGIEMGGIQT